MGNRVIWMGEPTLSNDTFATHELNHLESTLVSAFSCRFEFIEEPLKEQGTIEVIK